MVLELLLLLRQWSILGWGYFWLGQLCHEMRRFRTNFGFGQSTCHWFEFTWKMAKIFLTFFSVMGKKSSSLMSVLSGITYTWTLQQAKLYFRKLFVWHSKRVRPCCKHKSFCVVICFFTIWPKDITVYPINSHFRQKCLAVDTTTNSTPTDAFDVKK